MLQDMRESNRLSPFILDVMKSKSDSSSSVKVIDSHTGGEPTRVVVHGAPRLGNGPLGERRARFAAKYDEFRTSVICEPRGSDFLVGALLCEPVDSTCTTGVIFFNNVGYLGMCVHGLIGVAETLEYLGLQNPGENRIETPAGIVLKKRNDDGTFTVRNVPSYRFRKGVEIDVPGLGQIKGDVAWGGNWFFLVDDFNERISIDNVVRLTSVCNDIRRVLKLVGVTGDAGEEVDHVELFCKSANPEAHSKNFVLCPGGAFDRSPCGTGTSAKIACLIADGQLAPGDVWSQESITGSVFRATASLEGDEIVPWLTGRAHVCSEATLIFDDDDPAKTGFAS